MTEEEEAMRVARGLHPFEADWLQSLAYVYSPEGKERGARAYRMSYDYEVSSGVIDFTEHGGGHILDSERLKRLFDLGLAGVRWPCDAPGFVRDYTEWEDDDDEWGSDHSGPCESYCGECEPTVTITPLGLSVASAAKKMEE